ncbi:MAG: hypothetical protein WCC03_02850, partial [Candidatus Acidiferrales bacterium]
AIARHSQAYSEHPPAMPPIKNLESRWIAPLGEPYRLGIRRVALGRLPERFHPWAPQEFPMGAGLGVRSILPTG